MRRKARKVETTTVEKIAKTVGTRAGKRFARREQRNLPMRAGRRLGRKAGKMPRRKERRNHFHHHRNHDSLHHLPHLPLPNANIRGKVRGICKAHRSLLTYRNRKDIMIVCQVPTACDRGILWVAGKIQLSNYILNLMSTQDTPHMQRTIRHNMLLQMNRGHLHHS